MQRKLSKAVYDTSVPLCICETTLLRPVRSSSFWLSGSFLWLPEAKLGHCILSPVMPMHADGDINPSGACPHARFHMSVTDHAADPHLLLNHGC